MSWIGVFLVWMCRCLFRYIIHLMGAGRAAGTTNRSLRWTVIRWWEGGWGHLSYTWFMFGCLSVWDVLGLLPFRATILEPKTQMITTPRSIEIHTRSWLVFPWHSAVWLFHCVHGLINISCVQTSFPTRRFVWEWMSFALSSSCFSSPSGPRSHRHARWLIDLDGFSETAEGCLQWRNGSDADDRSWFDCWSRCSTWSSSCYWAKCQKDDVSASI